MLKKLYSGTFDRIAALFLDASQRPPHVKSLVLLSPIIDPLYNVLEAYPPADLKKAPITYSLYFFDPHF
jgi:hypothetical protein